MKTVIFDNYDETVIPFENVEAGCVYVIVHQFYLYILRKIEFENKFPVWTWIALEHSSQDFREANSEKDFPNHNFLEEESFYEIIKETHDKGYNIFQFDDFRDVVYEFSELENAAELENKKIIDKMNKKGK